MTQPGAETATAVTGRTLHPGTGTGALLRLDQPLSFWGGVDERGRVVDVHHPQHGALLTGRVLVMPAARGSSSSAAVLAEQVRAGVAPAAIVLGEPDTILVAGALVAAELYDVRLPVVVVPADALARLGRGAAHVHAGDETATVEIATVEIAEAP